MKKDFVCFKWIMPAVKLPYISIILDSFKGVRQHFYFKRLILTNMDFQNYFRMYSGLGCTLV